MSFYDTLAPFYDGLMSHVDYPRWADYMLDLAGPVHRVLDLGCGTGTFAEILCRRGRDVEACDRSAAMLSLAQRRDCGALFLQQDMTRLDLYGTVQAAFCTLDGMNHLTKPRDFLAAARRVRLFLEPGGAFVFDMLTPHALRARHGRVFSSESGQTLCLWRCHRQQGTPLHHAATTLFAPEPDGRYTRFDGSQTERAYSAQEVRALLHRAGFPHVSAYAMFSHRKPTAQTQRVVYVARKG